MNEEIISKSLNSDVGGGASVASSATATSSAAVAAVGLTGRQSFEKHTPVYPLPNEILTMPRDETVCQFCGVSYLIHNEIKKLEDRIKVSEIFVNFKIF